MSGFIAMSRDALNHPVLRDGERFRAWFWLVAHACWKPTRTYIKGEIVDLQRGELSFSVRFLAKSWGWSKSRVDRFIIDLRDQGMIETRSKNGTTAGHNAGQGQSIISICNYAKYQDVGEQQRDSDDSENGTTAGQQRDNSGTKKNKGTREQGNNKQKKEEVERASAPPAPVFPCPENVDPIDWSSFLANRKSQRVPMTEGAYRSILKKLDNWSRDGWPPGPIVACAVERGWRTIFETDEMKEARNHGPNIRAGSGQQPDKRSGLAKALDAEISRNRSARGSLTVVGGNAATPGGG